MAGTPLWSEELTVAAHIFYRWGFSPRCSSVSAAKGALGGSSAYSNNFERQYERKRYPSRNVSIYLTYPYIYVGFSPTLFVSA